MKKVLLSLALVIGFVASAQTEYYTAVPYDGATSGNSRAPQGVNRYARSVYLVPASEMVASQLANGDVINSIVFSYSVAQNIATTGNLTVYLQNTADATNLKSTTWATAITGMTTVSNAALTIPNTTGDLAIPFAGGSAFTYTGGAVYVAFDYSNPAGALSAGSTVMCNSTGLVGGLIGAQSTTVAPTTLTATSFRPATKFGKMVTCLRPTVFYFPDYTSTTSTDLFWDQTASNPTNYQVDWSTNFATLAGAGTNTGSVATLVAGAPSYAWTTVSGVPASSNIRYYVRPDCGGSFGSWAGPYYAYLPTICPYATTFEVAANNYTDGFIGFTRFTASGTSTPANYADGGAGNAMYTFNSTTTASNVRAYSRGLNLQAGEQVTVTFKTRLYSTGVASPMGFNLTVGPTQDAAGQATVVQSFTESGTAAYTTRTATYTAPTAGIYYFGIHNNAAIGAVQTYLFLDTLSFTSVLSVNDYVSNSFAVYPNPVNDVISISNAEKISVNSVVITDLNGRVIKQQSYTNVSEIEMNVSELSSGIYMININSDKGTATKKIIKN